MRTQPRGVERAGRTRLVLWAATLLLAMLAAAAIYVGARPAPSIVTNGPIFLTRGGELMSVDPAAAGAVDSANALLGCQPECPAISSVAWSPDGTRLAFAADGFLWVRDTITGQTRRLAPCCTPDDPGTPGAEPMAMDWSPDGLSMVFSLEGQLWVVDADGSDLRLVVSPDNGSATQPSWLVDGRRIGFILAEGETRSIATFDVGTGRTTKVVTGDGPYWAPAWSPDGTRIVYFTLGFPAQLISIGADGADPITLLEVPLCCTNTIPAAEWSPDGQMLAVVIQDLLLVETDGSGFRRLERGVAADRPAWRPVWIPSAQSSPALDTPGAASPTLRQPASAVPPALISAEIEMRSLTEVDLDAGKPVAFDDVGADLTLSSATTDERFFSHTAEVPLAHVLLAGGGGPGAGPLGPEGCAEALEAPEDIGIVLLEPSAISLDALTPESHICAATDEGHIAELWPVDISKVGDPGFTIHVEVWAVP
jgi:TolB protein